MLAVFLWKQIIPTLSGQWLFMWLAFGLWLCFLVGKQFWPAGSQWHRWDSCMESHALLSSQFCQHEWIKCSELPWDLCFIIVIRGWRLLPAIWPVTWLTSQRTEYGILPGGIPSFTINIPKPKSIFWERWWECFYTWSVSERMLFFLGPHVDPESKSAWACQSRVGVLWGPGPQLRRDPYLRAVRAWWCSGNVVLLSIFKTLNHLWQC